MNMPIGFLQLMVLIAPQLLVNKSVTQGIAEQQCMVSMETWPCKQDKFSNKQVAVGYFSASRSLTQHLFDCICILYLMLAQHPYDPGTLPGSAD